MSMPKPPTRQTPTPRYTVFNDQDGQGTPCWFVARTLTNRILSRSYDRADARLICRALNAVSKKGQ